MLRLKTVRYFLQACVVYALYGIFAVLPLDAASACGGWLLRKLGPRLKAHRIAQRNIKMVFPDMSLPEQRRLLQGMWDNLGRVIAEYPHLEEIAQTRVELVNPDVLTAIKARDAAVIFFAAHLANWEINGAISMLNGMPIHVVYRKPNNPFVDKLLRRARRVAAVGHIAKGPAGAKALLSVVRNKGFIGMLADQRLDEGVTLPFFGMPATMGDTLAIFALKYKALLCPIQGVRLGGGAHFRLTVSPPLEWQETGDKQADVKALLTTINQHYEAWIRENPSQWLWTHKRWPNALYKD